MAARRKLPFDLGGVLVEFVGLTEMQRLLQMSDAGDLQQRWVDSAGIDLA